MAKKHQQKSAAGLEGLVNLHLQDGIINPTDCVTMARKMSAAGFVGAVIAPSVHMLHPQVNRESIEKLVDSSRKLLKGDAEDFQLVAGGTLLMSESGFFPWGEETGFLTTDTKGAFVFVRFFNNIFRREHITTLQTMVNWGYRPVLVKPESIKYPPDLLISELRGIRDLGVEFLGDVRAFISKANETLTVSQALLEVDAYQWLGTSAQLADGVEAALEGVEFLRRTNGEGWIQTVMGQESVLGRLGAISVAEAGSIPGISAGEESGATNQDQQVSDQ